MTEQADQMDKLPTVPELMAEIGRLAPYEKRLGILADVYAATSDCYLCPAESYCKDCSECAATIADYTRHVLEQTS